MRMVSVIFPAAGQGRRMQAGVNKVFLELGGRPMLVRALLTFSACPEVGELIVAAAADEVEFLRGALAKVPGLKPWKVTAGGEERQYSVFNALHEVSHEAEFILVHDAARPLVTGAVIEAVIRAAKESGAAVAAVREKNTVKVVGEDGFVQTTPDRAMLWEVQTPQGFRRDILLRAHFRATEDGFLGTDDASLVERLGEPVRVAEGDYRNIKVTTPEDLLLVEAFLRDEIAARARAGMSEARQDVAEAARKIKATVEDLVGKAEAACRRMEEEFRR